MSDKKIQIIQVPYDSGNRSVRMGRGPEHFINNGLAQFLESNGHRITVESVESKTDFRAEIQTQFELYKLLAARVLKARTENKFPLVLSGNCGASLGAIAGRGQKERFGVIWFDAHGDFNTPETTKSGFLDGMGLATIAGLCWRTMARSIPDFSPISGENILHIGGRDFDTEERRMFQQTQVNVVDSDQIRQLGIRDALKTAMSKLLLAVEAVHLHIDLDVLDPGEAPANGYVTEEGGLSVENAFEAIRFIKESLPISSATVAAFDPEFDTQGKTLKAGRKLIQEIVNDADGNT